MYSKVRTYFLSFPYFFVHSYAIFVTFGRFCSVYVIILQNIRLHVTIKCQIYFAPNIAFYSRRNRNKLEKQVFQPRGTHKELRPSNTAPFCFAPPLWKPSYSKMTDLAGNSDENSALEALSEASKQPRCRR